MSFNFKRVGKEKENTILNYSCSEHDGMELRPNPTLVAAYTCVVGPSTSVEEGRRRRR